MNWSYFSISSAKLTIISFAIITVLLGVFGLLTLAINGVRGIKADGYSATNKHVYYDGKILVNADPVSFEGLGGDLKRKDSYRVKFAKDNQTVYFGGFPFLKADAATFRLVGDFKYHENYWIDKNHVYYEDEIIKSANADSFRFIGDYFYADKQHVYRNGKIFGEAIPDSFHLLKGKYWADKKHIYYDAALLVDAKPDDAIVLEKNYLKTSAKVYYGNDEIKDVNPVTFKPLTDIISKDDKHIYHGKIHIFPDADISSFKIIHTNFDSDYKYGKDKKNVYFLPRSPEDVRRLDELNPETTKIVYYYYAIDIDKVYYIDRYNGKTMLMDADARTFTVAHDDIDHHANSDAKDINNYFRDGVIIISVK